MRIVARVRPEWNQAYIFGTIQLQHIPNRMPIIFLIDTGCSETTLLQDDVIRLRINWHNLPEKDQDVLTASGRIRSRVLSDVDIFLPAEVSVVDNSSMEFQIHYEKIDIMPPRSGHLDSDLEHPRDCFSLLGMDILINFRKWRWESDKLILDDVGW